MAKKEAEEKIEDIDLSDILFDENNLDPISLVDDEGKSISFEQVAIIPLDGNIYVILKPIDEMEGVGEDEALVFKFKTGKEGEESTLVLEPDDEIGEKVFEEFYKMADEEENN